MPKTILIKILLLQKNLTIRAAADKLGMSDNLLTQLIHGHRPLYRYRFPLAELLGVSVARLFPRSTDHRRRLAV